MTAALNKGELFASFDVDAAPAGQPRVGWRATVIEKCSGVERDVAGHVEVRWAHGRFSSVEAKVYLDTPHADVPGYFGLAQPERSWPRPGHASGAHAGVGNGATADGE